MIEGAKYLTSVTQKSKILQDNVPEVAFVGRSNVGKSSLINSLARQKKLARISSIPGRTRMINYFDVGGKFRLVDLPGYGYAKAGKDKQSGWNDLIGTYITKNTALKQVFVLVDIRLPALESDKDMIEYLRYYKVPFMVIATKADKLAKSKVAARVLTFRQEFGTEVRAYSSETGFGRSELIEYVYTLI